MPEQPAVRRTSTRGITAVAAAFALVAGILTWAQPSAHATGTGFIPGDVAVYQVGDGTTALTSNGAPVFIDEYNSAGTQVQSVPLPATGKGTNKPLVGGGSASSEGLLTLSGNGQYLAATGYDAAVGAQNLSSSAAATVPRTVARIAADDTVDTTTALTDFADGNNPRSAVTNDGSEFWLDGAAGGVRYAALGATTSTTLVSTAAKNQRQVSIYNGQLYTSADPSKNSTTIATVGANLPTSGTNAVTNLSFASSPSEPYAYSFLTLANTGTAPDTMYVADNTAGAVVKYSLVSGKWTQTGSAPVSGVTGVTANDNNGTVTIYATSSGANGTTAALYQIVDTSGLGGALNGSAKSIFSDTSNTIAFRGVAFVPGTTIGHGSGTPPPTPPTISTAHAGLPAALGDPTNPTLGITVGDANADASQLTVTATSSVQSVAANSGITVSGTGANRTLMVTPSGVGDATITVTVTAPDTTTATALVQYGVSANLGSGIRYYTGAGNGSTAIDVGGGYFIVGDDESNVLRLYQLGQSGPPTTAFDFTSVLPSGTTEIDIEAAARSGNVIYWTGSMSNSDSGNLEPARSTIFATRVNGSGAATTLTYLGSYTGLRADLIAWDQNNGSGLGANALGLAAGAQAGVSGHDADAFNVEGMEMAGSSTSTAYLAFRAPLEPPAAGVDAMLIPVTNVDAITTAGNPGTTHATFGAPIFFNLGGLGIRDIRENADGQYLIIAGTADGSNTSFVLYTWDGIPADAPRATGTALPQIPTPDNVGSWETIISVPDPLLSGSTVQLMQDDGSVDWYDDGLSSKDGIPADLQKSLGETFSYVPPAAQQTTTTLSAQPTPASAGDSVTYTATITDGVGAWGTPTGTVDFAEGGTDLTGCSQQPVSAGIATCTITYPVVGSHQVVATYSGDANFAGSVSSAFSETVSSRASAVSVSAGAGPFVAGTAVTITATVSGTVLVPTGSVTFSSDGAPLDGCASVPLVDGAAACSVGAGLDAGTHSLTAAYSGDDTFGPSDDTADPTSITVDPAESLSWTAPAPLTYGSALGASLDATSNIDGTFAYSVGSGPTGTAGETIDASTVLPAGTYLLAASFTPTDGAEYLSEEVDTSLTVDPAPLTVTAADATSTYGQPLPTFTDSITGFVNGDPSSVVTGAAFLSTTATQGSGVGPYAITAADGTLSAANYTFTFVPGTLTVDPATLTVTIANATRKYGQANPTFTDTITGFVNGDPSSVVTGAPQLSTTATQGSDAGTYAITGADGSLSAANYTFAFTPGTLTVTRVTLTVKLVGATRVYGQPDPVYTAKFSGFVNGDDVGVLGGALVGTATITETVDGLPTVIASSPSSPVGTYTVAGSGYTSPDYTLKYANNTLRVTAAPLTVTVNPSSRSVGQADPAFTVSYSGFVNNEDASDLGGALSFSATIKQHGVATPSSPTSPAGKYVVAASGLVSANYKIKYVTGTMTVTKTG